MDVRVGYVGHVDLENSRFHSTISSSVVVAPECKPRRDDSKRMNGRVAEQFFQRHAVEGELVADFMCGSGTASIAAVDIGLSCLAVDMDPEMVCCLQCYCLPTQHSCMILYVCVFIFVLCVFC